MSTNGIKGRSLQDFAPLSAAEQQLLACCSSGQLARVSNTRPQVPYPMRVIRAAFLRFLILGGDRNTAIHERGIRVQGAYISGHLDLRNSKASTSFELRLCTFEQPLNLNEAEITGAIRLSGCRVPKLLANRCVIHSDLRLTNTWLEHGLAAWNASIQGNLILRKVKSDGSLSLPGTQISGMFHCFKSSLLAANEPALILNNLTLGAGIYFADSKLQGLRCQLATINGGFRLQTTTLLAHEGVALDLSGTQLRHNLFMSGAQVQGQTRLASTRVGGTLSLDGAFDGGDADAVNAHGAVLQGELSLPKGFSAKGTVRFTKAQIHDNAELLGRFEGTDVAIIFDSAKIDGRFNLSRAEVFGEVRLITTQIGGQLVCKGTQLHVNNGNALSADAATIGRDAHFIADFYAKGTVRLLCTTFEGDLIFNHARFEGDAGSRSLNANQSKILGKVVLNVQANGSVAFNDACIEGELRCDRSTFATDSTETLSLKKTRIKGTLSLLKFASPLRRASFEHAQAGRLDDDEDTWGEQIVLNGFKYDALAANPPLSLATRLKWLQSQVAQLAAPTPTQPSGRYQRIKCWLNKRWPGVCRFNARRAEDFRPQPWWQLKQVLEDSAHFAEARRVGIELEKERRKLGLIDQPLDPEHRHRGLLSRLVSRCLHWAYGQFTDYGYRPIKLLHYFVGTWLVCAAIYWAAALVGIFAPTDPRIYQNPAYQACRPSSSEAWPAIEPRLKENWYLCAELPAEYTGFSPLAYSLDVLMPFVDLKQETDWAPLVPTPKADPSQEFQALTAQHAVRLVIWLQTLIGWGIGLLAAAIISGLARKTE